MWEGSSGSKRVDRISSCGAFEIPTLLLYLILQQETTQTCDSKILTGPIGSLLTVARTMVPLARGRPLQFNRM